MRIEDRSGTPGAAPASEIAPVGRHVGDQGGVWRGVKGTVEPGSHPDRINGIIQATGLANLGPQAPPAAQESALRALEAAAAGLDAIQLQLLRHGAIQALSGVGVRGAAGLVDAALHRPGGSGEPPGGLGTPVLFPEVVPWPNPVAGATLLKELEVAIMRHVVVSEDAAAAMALWILHTHAIDAAQITPRLAIVSPTKRCGKSTVLKILGALVRRPLASTNVTAAGIYRGIEAHRPTLLVDEADTFLEGREDLRGVLNAGHDRQSAMVMRVAGDELEPRLFRVFAPVAIAAIGRLPDTLMDRSIVIEMRRKTGGEAVERLRRAQRDALGDIPRRCARWVADHLDALKEATPEIMAALNDREADNWEALFAIADAVGDEWPARARTAAWRLSGARADIDDAEDLAVQLLADVRLVFAEQGGERITTKALLAALTGLEGRPWGEINRGRPITDRFIGLRLRRFGVCPRTIRVGDATPKGYLLADLTDAFARYLATPAATAATSSESFTKMLESHPPHGAPVADADLPETRCDSADVADVALGDGCCLLRAGESDQATGRTQQEEIEWEGQR